MSTVNSFIKLDPAKCIDCGACQAACLNFHGKLGNVREGKEKGLIVINCQHCENAPCGNSCPVDAITQGPNGIEINDDLCVGCGSCERACPFNAILMLDRKYDENTDPNVKRYRRIAHKCDLCEGMKGNKCVEFCPTAALTLVNPMEEQEKKAIKIANTMAPKK
ncbi:4Fe-4S dicluster domain-containing protein [Clostridium cylindrosporum]|uniref:Putative hydrogenase, 4Fe-4S ferredoxin-type component YiaI n=1 Tax=Clostridium cylindrosporum DSM 605 TaxID=1121307 RepID=A0A0J8D8C6_CLOCY|nr:4Fe-4S dicluster domain-containing protein [Clostridium cylindrosporum]KMT22122.1 putative hydrogenase, 4Fe-4S ferredoxin-type component YiaI [Clostridium cylindrosporum DSM 605]